MLPDDSGHLFFFQAFYMYKISTAHLHTFHIFILAGLVWIAFGNSLNHDFAWDDHDLIINNNRITRLSFVSGFFARSFWHITFPVVTGSVLDF